MRWLIRIVKCSQEIRLICDCDCDWSIIWANGSTNGLRICCIPVTMKFWSEIRVSWGPATCCAFLRLSCINSCWNWSHGSTPWQDISGSTTDSTKRAPAARTCGHREMSVEFANWIGSQVEVTWTMRLSISSGLLSCAKLAEIVQWGKSAVGNQSVLRCLWSSGLLRHS